jgi:hypothetical protein
MTKPTIAIANVSIPKVPRNIKGLIPFGTGVCNKNILRVAIIGSLKWKICI